MIGSRNANNSVLLATAAVASVVTAGVFYWIASRKKGGEKENEDGSSSKGEIYTIIEESVQEESTADGGFLDEQTYVVDEDKVGLSIDGVDEHDVPALLDEPPSADYDENSMSSKSESNYLPAAISGPDLSALMLKEKVNNMMDAEEQASTVASTTASDMTGGDFSNKLDLAGVAEDNDSFLPKKKKSLVGAFKKKLSRRRSSKNKASSP